MTNACSISGEPWLACAGDIVLARSVQNPKQIVCKRVLGLEGDEVKVHQSTQLGHSRIVKVCAALFSRHCCSECCTEKSRLFVTLLKPHM